MNQTGDVGMLTAFIAGFLSFLSPCVFPLIPSYISYITGITFGGRTEAVIPRKVRILTAVHSIFFIAGFTVIFVLIGMSFSLLGNFVLRNQRIMERAGGLIVILFGLHIAGVINLNFLDRAGKIGIKAKPLGYLGSFIVGAVFSLGWSPCLGPILSSILVLGSTTGRVERAGFLLLSYSLGIGLPFFLSGILINNFLSFYGSIKRYLKIISVISGIFIIIVGILIFTGYFNKAGSIFT